MLHTNLKDPQTKSHKTIIPVCRSTTKWQVVASSDPMTETNSRKNKMIINNKGYWGYYLGVVYSQKLLQWFIFKSYIMKKSFTYCLLVLLQQTLFVGHTQGTLGRHQQVAWSEIFLHFPVTRSIIVTVIKVKPKHSQPKHLIIGINSTFPL